MANDNNIFKFKNSLGGSLQNQAFYITVQNWNKMESNSKDSNSNSSAEHAQKLHLYSGIELVFNCTF